MASMKSRWARMIGALTILWGKVKGQQTAMTALAHRRGLTQCRLVAAVAAWMAAQAERTPRHTAVLIEGAANCLEVGEAKLDEATKASPHRHPFQVV